MKLEIEVDDDTAMYVGRFLSMLDPKIEANTHGPLDMAGLATMLLQDVALDAASGFVGGQQDG